MLCSSASLWGCIGIAIDALAALLTAMAAIAAVYAVRAARDATRASVIASLLSAYADPDMGRSLWRLRQWQDERGQSFASDFRAAREARLPKVLDLDLDRRRIAHWFQAVHALATQKFIPMALTKVVVTPGQASFYLEVIEPMERAISVQYDDRSFEFFSTLQSLPRPAIATSN